LNGTNVGWEETKALDAEPVPPPVKFAPLGYPKQEIVNEELKRKKGTHPNWP
jgi:hypothetical protein